MRFVCLKEAASKFSLCRLRDANAKLQSQRPVLRSTSGDKQQSFCLWANRHRADADNN